MTCCGGKRRSQVRLDEPGWRAQADRIGYEIRFADGTILTADRLDEARAIATSRDDDKGEVHAVER